MSLVYSMKRALLVFFGFLIFTNAFANKEALHEEKPFNVNEMIMHHIKDAHEWHLWGGHHNSTSIYLPVILVDNGIKTFSSREFYHGQVVEFTNDAQQPDHYYVEPTGNYAMVHEKIYKLNGKSALEFHEGHPVAEKPLDLSLTKNVLSLLMGSLLIIILMTAVARYYKTKGAVAPKGLAKYVEPLILMVRDNVAKANIGEHKYKKYVPFLLTVFFFIFVNNLLGLVPILPGGANLTGNITITFFLAICTLLATVFSGNRNYWGHIFATPGVPKALLPIMIPIEIVGILTKPFALMVRLFANMTAGHIIVLALIGIIFINKSAAWGALSVPMALFISVLELLVAFLQGYLFIMLSALFIGAAVEEHHH